MILEEDLASDGVAGDVVAEPVLRERVAELGVVGGAVLHAVCPAVTVQDVLVALRNLQGLLEESAMAGSLVRRGVMESHAP